MCIFIYIFTLLLLLLILIFCTSRFQLNKLMFSLSCHLGVFCLGWKDNIIIIIMMFISDKKSICVCVRACARARTHIDFLSEINIIIIIMLSFFM